uniref:Uncharacterized protein n=1 Tax=Octopus bimaculoides TaxID=37653 RepID=A0A0L8H0Q2_OCTBM
MAFTDIDHCNTLSLLSLLLPLLNFLGSFTTLHLISVMNYEQFAIFFDKADGLTSLLSGHLIKKN